MKETILLYNFTDSARLLKVKKALIPLGMRLRAVKKEEYLEAVGVLAGDKEVLPNGKVYEGEEFEKEMMVMAGLTSNRVDAVLMALRKTGAGRVDYKAILTPVNRYWDSVTLYKELSKEHEAVTGQK